MDLPASTDTLDFYMMHWWYQITALGGIGVTGSLSVAIALWLATAHCRVRALYWCMLFGGAMLLVIASKIAFIGWGVGLMSVDFAGFSGHASRAAAVFPVAAYLLLRKQPSWLCRAGVAGAVLLALLVTYSRIAVKTHSTSEAVLGCALGLMVAAAFITLVRSPRDFSPHPVLVALTLAVLVLLPQSEQGHKKFNSQQLMTGVALNLSGNDRPYQRWNWKPAATPYVPPCTIEKIHFSYVCG